MRPTTRSASQSAVTWVGAGILPADRLRPRLERLPERRHVLAQLPYHHVAAVEAEVEGTLGRTLGRQAGTVAGRLVLDHRPGRVLVVRIGVAEQDFSQRHAVPEIAGRGLAVLADDKIPERNRLRQPVGEAEMFSGDAVLVAAQIEGKPVDHAHLVGREPAFDLLRPGFARRLVLVVDQQQSVHRLRRRERRRGGRLVGRRRRIAAPLRPALDHRGAPLVAGPIAQAAQPVLLQHAFLEGGEKSLERRLRQAELLQA